VLSRICDFCELRRKKESRTFLTGVKELILVRTLNRMTFWEKINLLTYVIIYLLTYLLTPSSSLS